MKAIAILVKRKSIFKIFCTRKKAKYLAKLSGIFIFDIISVMKYWSLHRSICSGKHINYNKDKTFASSK